MSTAGSELVNALYGALQELVESAATLEAVAAQEVLLGLTRVRGSQPDAPSERLAQLARDEIMAACQALDDPKLAVEPRWQRQGGAVLALLGLATGYRGTRSKRRREGAASLLGYSVETAFKTRPGSPSHTQTAVYAVADKLWERDIAERAKAAAGLAVTGRAGLSEMAVEMLRRYEAYYTMYTPLSGLRADLAGVLELRRSGDDAFNRIADYLASSLHAYSEFLLAKRDFMERYAGVWVFADAEIEQSMADAIKLIEHFSGLRYREESLLRIERATHHELHPFTQGLEAEQVGREALRRWRERIMDCTCDLEQPSSECRVHQLMRACHYYTLVLDTDWYRVIPWHSGPPPNMGLIDPATLYREVGLEKPPQW